ncbi:MAG: distal tail protein Dit [Christensenellales bacterium]
MSWFEFKGVISSSLNVVVSEYPPIIRARRRVETVTVPGRSGELTLATGPAAYDSMVREIKCYARPGADLNEIADWLTGSGTLIFGNEPDFAYEAQVIEEISMDRIMRGREHKAFSVPFLCQPLKKRSSGDTAITLTAAGSVFNPGHVMSRPKITVTGSGNIVLTMGGTETTITGLSSAVVIDSDLGMAMNTDEDANLSSIISGEWPELEPGANAVSWTGTVTSVVIQPRWRWL